MKISELARATRTPVGTIRHYEREGLLPEPPRQQDNGYRRYSPADVERLGLIRQARALDMSLDEIRVLLALHDTPQAPCDAVNALLDAHIGHVSARILELQQLEARLQQLRARCEQAGDAGHCGILAGLATSEPAGPDAAPGAGSLHAGVHVGGAHRGHGH
jgi:Cd(II)/Pb(II)-responsive transcriptional regulator